MNEGRLFGQGISFPPRIGPDGRWAWSVGADNIRESIQVILLTEAEERVMRPEFGGGLHAFLFEPNTVATHRLIQEQIIQSLGRWEPRILLENVSVQPDPTDRQAAIITIEYKLVATGVADQLGLTIRLTG
jgi:phage baseplate assembly protein W